MSIAVGAGQVPTHWYNIRADLPFEVPRPRPGPNASAIAQVRPQLPLSLFRQSAGEERFIKIPELVRMEYTRWRPTPLYRATRFEEALDTPAHIYFKYEGTSPSGSHKTNTALPQAYYYHRSGISEMVTGTGAGQWGTALAMSCLRYGLECTVFMVRCSLEQKPYRSTLMRLNGARVVASPSDLTEVGRSALRADPNAPGSLAIANAEAIEYAATRPKARFSIGSGEDHVLMHQTVSGEESLLQTAAAGEFPDVVVGAMGAGSNFSGLAFPFYREALAGNRALRLVAVEPEACPKMTRGTYSFDYTDYSGVTPQMKMYTLGHTFAAREIHAGGLRYHGAAPIVSAMFDHGIVEAVAYPQSSVFKAGTAFARAEGIVPAPESAHAIARAVDEALEARRDGKPRVILFCLSGHGLLDLGAYEEYLSGNLIDARPTDEDIESSLRSIP